MQTAPIHMPQVGHANGNSTKQLTSELNDAVERLRTRTALRHPLLRELRSVNVWLHCTSVLMLAAAAVLARSHSSLPKQLAVEATILFVFLVVSLAINVRQSKHADTHVETALKKCTRALNLSNLVDTMEPPRTRAISWNWVWKGGFLRRIPTALLTRGSSILMPLDSTTAGDGSLMSNEVLDVSEAPDKHDLPRAASQQSVPLGRSVSANSSLAVAAAPPSGTSSHIAVLQHAGLSKAIIGSMRSYKVQLSPAVKALQTILSKKPVLPPFDEQFEAMFETGRKLLVVSVVLSAATLFGMLGVTHQFQEYPISLVLSRLACLILPGLLCFLPLLFMAVRAAVNSTLLSLTQESENSRQQIGRQQSRRRRGTTAGTSHDNYQAFHDVESSDVEISAKLALLQTKTQSLLARFFKEMSAMGTRLDRSSGGLYSLGRATTLVVLDKEGLLSEADPSVKQIIVPSAIGEGDAGDNWKSFNLDAAAGYCRVMFEDADWREHTPSLRPVGLACASTSSITAALPPTLSDCSLGLCKLADTIGFIDGKPGVLVPRIIVVVRYQDGSAVVRVISEEGGKNGGLQVMVRGSPKAVMRCCNQAWAGKEARPINRADVKQIRDFSSIFARGGSHASCQALAYIPANPNLRKLAAGLDGISFLLFDALPEEQGSKVGTHKLQAAQSSLSLTHVAAAEALASHLNHSEHVLLGAAGMRKRPLPGIAQMVEELQTAGVRFSWMCEDSEDVAKPFAAELGLETDWNCCLSLQSPSDRQIKERLPRGMEQILEHLEVADDVPLRVPIFADASPKEVANMVETYRNYGEVVMVVGSSLRLDHAPVHQAADLSVACNPLLSSGRRLESLQGSGLSTARALSTLPCLLTIDNLTDLLGLLSTARTMHNNSRQSMLFAVSSSCMLTMAMLLCNLAGFPQLLSTGRAMWLQVLVIPALSLSILSTPAAGNEMQLMPLKTLDVKAQLPRQVLYLMLRQLPAACFLSFFFAWLLSSEQNVPLSALFGLRCGADDGSSPIEEATQETLFVLCVGLCVVQSGLYMHRTQPLWVANPVANKAWLTVVCVVIFLHTGWALLQMLVLDRVVQLSISQLVSALAFPLVVTPFLHELVRRNDQAKSNYFQRFRNLEFNTKLGQTSPI